MRPKLRTADKVEAASRRFFNRTRRHQFEGGRISNMALRLADIAFIA